MRRTNIQTAFLAISAALVLFASSCKKEEDEGAEPVITFRTGASSVPGISYTSGDATKNAGDTCIIGIKAYKAEAVDVLKSFKIVKNETGLADSTILTTTLTTAQQDTFYTEYQYVVPANKAQKLTFTVFNRDNIDGNASLTVTSH